MPDKRLVLLILVSLGICAAAAAIGSRAIGGPPRQVEVTVARACISPGDPAGCQARTAARARRSISTGSVPRPGITRQALVTTGADGNSSDGGNAWGAQKLRIVRSSGGMLFAVYPSGPDTVNKTYNLMASTDGGLTWSRISDGLTINGQPDDGGRETPLLLISSHDVVYLISWAGGSPSLVNEGIDGDGPYSVTAIPGSWQRGDNYPYAGAAVDSHGNVYIEENTASSTFGADDDSGQIMNLAWTTQSAHGFVWHFTRLPARPGDDYRYAYSFELPGSHGVFDVVATRVVSCSNAGFDSRYGYTPSSDSYMLDDVQDWHTGNLNRRGGPSWTISDVAHDYGNTCGRSFINNNTFAQDAYRDTSGAVHVMYFTATDAINGYHAVIDSSRGRWSLTDNVRLPYGYCENEARITQDASGRLYVISQCANQLYIWPARGRGGTVLRARSALRLKYPIDDWDYLAAQGEPPLRSNYVDMVYPTNNATGLAYVRIRLAVDRATRSKHR